MTKEQSQDKEAETRLSIHGAGTTGHPHEKMKRDTDLYTLSKGKIKMDHRPDCDKSETLKLLEDHTEENLDDLECDDDFSDGTPKAPSMKEAIDKLDFIKIKSFCSTKTLTRMRGQERTGRKYSQETSDKGL